MADISKIKLAGEQTARNLKDATARSNLATLMGTGKTAGTDVLGAAAWEGVASAIDGTGLVSAAIAKAYVDAQVGAINKFDVKIYEAKGGTGSDKNDPKTAASANTMYILGLVQDSDAEAGTYVEYITVRSGSAGSYTYAWEKIGSTKTDLTGYVQNSRTVAGLGLSADISVADLQTALGLGALAYAATASDTYTPAGTISEVDATPAGTVSVVLENDTAASATITTKAAYTPAGSVTGTVVPTGTISVSVKDAASATAVTDLTYDNYTPAGSVALTADNDGAFQPAGTVSAPTITVDDSAKDTFVKSLKAGTVAAASFTEGAFTAASYDAGFLSTGAQASFTQGAKASLTDQTKSDFATEGLKASCGTGDDAETLIFTAAGTSKAVTDRGTFTANGDDSFTANTLQTLDSTKFHGGSKAADTFASENLPVVDGTASAVTGVTATSSAPTFTGNKYTPAFTGTAAAVKLSGAKYLKQEINTATFTGNANGDAITATFAGTEAANLIPTAITYVPQKVKSATFTGTSNKITPTFTGTEATITVEPDSAT